MTTIYKFPIRITDEQTVKAPGLWRPISVQVQNGEVCIWAIVNTDNGTEEIPVQVRGTGHPVGKVGAFLGTVQTGPLVWHVFTGRPMS